MALGYNLTLKNGTIITYWRIGDLNVDRVNNKLHIRLDGYISEALSNKNGYRMSTTIIKVLDYNTNVVSAVDFVGAAYILIKNPILEKQLVPVEDSETGITTMEEHAINTNEFINATDIL